MELEEFEPRTWGNTDIEDVSGDEALDTEGPRLRRKTVKDKGFSDQDRRLSLILVLSCILDMIISSVTVAMALKHAYRDNGVSLYCLAIQSVSHGLSSLLLTIRFISEYRTEREAPAGPEEGLIKQRRRQHLVREKYLIVGMGCLMFVCSFTLLGKSIRKIKFWDRWYQDHMLMDVDAKFATMFLAWYGSVVYGLQAFIRGALGKAFDVTVLWYGFETSLVSLVFIFVLAVAVTFQKEWSWKAEPIAAVVLALFTMTEGGRFISNCRGSVDLVLKANPRG